MVDHDGRADAVIQSQLIVVLDNLIAEKRLPMKDPDGRGVIGQSSGSAAAFAMTWFHPEWYHRVALLSLRSHG